MTDAYVKRTADVILHTTGQRPTPSGAHATSSPLLLRSEATHLLFITARVLEKLLKKNKTKSQKGWGKNFAVIAKLEQAETKQIRGKHEKTRSERS